MRKSLWALVVGLMLQSCGEQKTEVVLLGTVHQPIENFTPDSLFSILEKIQPDLILFEVDSSFFNEEFSFNRTWESNENIATVKYMGQHQVMVRPYDFTGRNEYRKKIGSRPTDGLATRMLDSLYQNGLLSEVDASLYEFFLSTSEELNGVATKGAKAFNNREADEIASLRQSVQYDSLKVIMSNYPVFSNTYYKMSDMDSVSYMQGFTRAGEFWHMRNNSMSQHILHFVKSGLAKRIVVLNGYYHRYYLNALLKPEQEAYNFVIKNFDEY